MSHIQSSTSVHSQVTIQPAEQDFDNLSAPQSQLNITPADQDFDDIADQRLPPLETLRTQANLTETETESPWYARIWLWLLLSGALALFGGLGFDLVSKYVNHFDKTPIFSTIMLSANGLFVSLLLWLGIKELHTYWRISSLNLAHQQVVQLAQTGTKEEINHLLQQIDQSSNRSPIHAKLHQHFWASIQEHHSTAERLHIYRTLVAIPLRETAEALIQPAMLQGAGLSLISPSSGVHTLILLWRSAKLVRDIAEVYGQRPGFFATLALLKIALENAILQQGSDLLIDAGVSKLSEGVLSLLAEKGAEATVTSLLIRRLAKATIEVLDVTREVH